MLQQTQVSRVAEKYPEFMNSFPTIKALAAASLKDVLTVWQGMGYNRRAGYLNEIARRIEECHGGSIPRSAQELARLPGIGAATAASICVFAHNAPVVFVETNIRAVYIHFFFHGRDSVRDEEVTPLVEATLDRRNSRRWYSALMDYGAMLKRRNPNPSRRSAHHHSQAPFVGSRRQSRGLVLKALLERSGMTVKGLSRAIDRPRDTTVSVLDELVEEGLVKRKGGIFYL
jgi:A/G-specific adenine glycosylase